MSSAVAAAPAPPFTKDHPFPARLIENRLLSRSGSAKEVRHYVVDLAGSGLTFKPGDSLGIYPTNRPEEVEELLRSLGASGAETVTLARGGGQLPLREALLHRLALAGPTRRFLETLAGRTGDPAERARLAELLAPGAETALTAWLGQREYVDLLAEFPGAKVAPQEFVDHLRRLVPRLYSIASSLQCHPHVAHLLVATVRYETNRRRRFGVCSTFVADRVAVSATPVPVFVAPSNFSLPADGAVDIIMVGPGTGIAPFRAFVQERVATGAAGRHWLFFGDQRRATDFVYEAEWNEYLARGHLARLDLAFSRDQPRKIYVQQRMLEQGAELWRWLQRGAWFYVCGDAQRMAKDVDAALQQIVAGHGGLEAAMAADYVKRMKKERRYQREVY